MNIAERSSTRENKIEEPILYVEIEPTTKMDYINIIKALKKIYQENSNFKVRIGWGVKCIIITGTEELTLEEILDRLMKEFNIEMKVENINIIYKTTIKNPIKTEGKFIRQ
jgi:elongation factor G